MTNQTHIDATAILRHKPPFRFIADCQLDSERQLTAAVPATPPEADWAAPNLQSVLPVEYAAQAMGVLIRHRLQAPGLSGVLAGVSEFAWDCAATPLRQVTVRHMGSRGPFHDFKAHFIGQDGYVCARVTGLIHLSPAAMATPVPPAAVAAPASLPRKGSLLAGSGFADMRQDTALFETVATTKDADGLCHVLRANPDCPVYAGHFPGAPITPGVLIAEAMVRAAADDSPELALAALTDLTFKAPLLPGDTVELRIKRRSDIGFSASVNRGPKRLARAKFALVHLPATRTYPNPNLFVA